VVAIVSQEVVGCALEAFGGFFNDGFEFGFGEHGVALENFEAKCSAWGFLTRSGRVILLARHPQCKAGTVPGVVYTADAASVVTSICIFSALDHHTSMQQ
jgi:hypothetical protein